MVGGELAIGLFELGARLGDAIAPPRDALAHAVERDPRLGHRGDGVGARVQAAQARLELHDRVLGLLQVRAQPR